MHSKIVFLVFFASFFLACNGEKKTEESNPAVSNTESESISTKEKVKTKNIIFFGNSLTAAYGLDPSDGFVSLIQQRIDSLGLPYKAVNAGLSGETTAGGKERIDWVLRQPVDVFVLELGGNDALRGIEPDASLQNLDAILNAVKEKYPSTKLILAGMEAPPNMGQRFTSKFREMYPKLAEKHQAALIPFFLDGVAGIPDLNQSDRVHPNEKGQFILLENVWAILEKLIIENGELRMEN